MDQNLQDMEIGNTKEDVMTSDVDKQGYTQREWDRVVGYGKVPEEYKKKYPFINQVRPFNIHSVYKMQRYLPGEGYFTLHCENDGPDFTGERSEMLILAWMIYLNDVTDGGYTEFPSQNTKFQPRRGDLLIWPAYFTHPHRGIVSKTQVKYILTGWYAFKH